MSFEPVASFALWCAGYEVTSGRPRPRLASFFGALQLSVPERNRCPWAWAHKAEAQNSPWAKRERGGRSLGSCLGGSPRLSEMASKLPTHHVRCGNKIGIICRRARRTLTLRILYLFAGHFSDVASAIPGPLGRCDTVTLPFVS